MKRRREAMVGFVIVLGLFVAVAGTLWLQGFEWGRETVEIDALFRDVGQLKEGDIVRLRGVNIGRVHAIAVEPGGEAVRVRLRIDADIPLPRDAVALLAPESMFGVWQAEILPRSRFPHFEYIETDELGVLAGHALPDISRLTATADQISQDLAVLTERITIAFTEETALNVARVIDNVEGMSRQLAELVNQQGAVFEEVAGEVQIATREISQASIAARRGFERVDELLGAGDVELLLADARATAENMRELSAGLGETNERVQGIMARADSSLARFDRVAASIEQGDGAVGRLLSDPTLAVRMEESLQQLMLLLEDVRENPKRYVRLSIF